MSGIALEPYTQGKVDGMYVLSNQQLTRQLTAAELVLLDVQSQHNRDADYAMATRQECEVLRLRVSMLERRMYELMKELVGIEHVA